MHRYIAQLIGDITTATNNASFPYIDKELSLDEWLSPDEEDATARIRGLEEWTGIYKEQLPPEDLLSDEQVDRLLVALNKMLDAYNCCFVLQTTVPERVQYKALRNNFDQDVKVKQWHMGFFEMCKPGTTFTECALGQHCQCAFYEELFAGMIDEDLSPEEERRRMLEIEIKHLKRKYEDDWMRYYPYHLDPDFDNEDGVDNDDE